MNKSVKEMGTKQMNFCHTTHNIIGDGLTFQIYHETQIILSTTHISFTGTARNCILIGEENLPAGRGIWEPVQQYATSLTA
jgi:hypothetical protein